MTCGVDTDGRFSQARKTTLSTIVCGAVMVPGTRVFSSYVLPQIPMLHRDKPAGSLPGEGTKRRVENGAEG